MLWTCNIWLILGLFIFAITTVVTFVVGLADENWSLVIVGVLCAVATYQCAISNYGEIQYTQYKVTISEDIKMSDFMNKYQIISQEGKIYTITKREVEK